MKNDVSKKLITAALKARKNAYAPYSDHPVGVAILSDDGKVYSGSNCEFANYDNTCAENTAIAAMATDGGRKIRTVVVAGPGADYLCTPCGRCRQRIREFSDSGTRIYALWRDGRVGAVYTVAELLPHSFGPEHMAEVGKGPQKAGKKKHK